MRTTILAGLLIVSGSTVAIAQTTAPQTSQDTMTPQGQSPTTQTPAPLPGDPAMPGDTTAPTDPTAPTPSTSPDDTTTDSTGDDQPADSSTTAPPQG
jgi:hypothetical protein